MAFDPAFLDELRARTPIAAVIGRKVKLVRSGRQYKACCPFHGEKTPSFYVYEDGFHCFGCGAHGDAISFVMQSEGRSFLEAVEALASEAGLEVPKQTPVDRERAERTKTLTDVLDAAQQGFVRRLGRPEGAAGLVYLRGRGLTDATIAEHGLGWSGDGRGALMTELREQGFEPAMIAEAGLMRLDEEGRPKGELFFNRVTFPIRDRRGGLVSFGGRILSDGQPKYLNGPETPLFSKRRTLFGLDRANKALRTVRPDAGGSAASRTLLVVEGYMDVIALDQVGFSAAVAPLGTALTAEQLEALWRADPAPVLCFDGDKAGRSAARKAAEVALPMLDPDRTLRFMSLQEGEDPDSLVRKQGARAMQAAIEAARPLGAVLFGLLSEGVRDPGPEQRAALMGRLMEAAARIGHKGLSAEYRETLRQQFREAFSSWRGQGSGRTGPGRDGLGRGPGRGGSSRGGSDWHGGAAGWSGNSMAAIPRRAPEADSAALERKRLLVAILLHHPDLLHDVEQAFCQVPLSDELARVRAAMLEWAGGTGHHGGEQAADGPQEPSPALDSASLIAHLHSTVLSSEMEMILAPSPLPLARAASAGSMPAEAEEAWWEFLGHLNAPSLQDQVLADERRLAESWNPEVQKRLILLRRAQMAVQRGEQSGDDD